MKRIGPLRAIVFLLLMFLAPPAVAQYMFLDSNGDGVNNDQDRLDPGGTATIDVWLDTAKNRDGSPTTCDVDVSKAMSIASWEIVLHAVGGTIDWGRCDNLLSISPSRACFATGSDTTDPVWYHNGWGGYYILPPGLYHVARLPQVRAVIGNPAIVIEPYNPDQPTDLTSFGTQCDARDADNTYKLGADWNDVDGIGGRIIFASAGGPYRGVPGAPIQFSSAGSRSSGGSSLTYQWDLGDGTLADDPAPSHVYAAPGVYNVTLTLSDGTQTFTNWTTVTILNQTPPVADPGGPYTGVMGIAVLLDGRRSSDVNGDPLSYTWTFGDGTGGATGPYAYHTYYAPGTYTVTLTVRDGYFTINASTEVTIRPEPEQVPISNAGGPYRGYVGLPLQLDGSASFDPDGDPLNYWWIFGDGNVGAGVRPTHAYADAGDFEVILEVFDGTLRTSSATTASIVTPAGLPPVAHAGGPYQGLVATAIAFDGSASFDPDGDPLTFAWDFGDKTNAAGAHAEHAYASPGTYLATLTATDGIYHVDDRTEAFVTSGEGPAVARAFLQGGGQSVALGAGPGLAIHIEPVGGSFHLEDIDLNELALRCQGSGLAIRPVGRPHAGGDDDQNGVDELRADFREGDLQSMLRFVRSPGPVVFTLEGATRAAGPFKATLTVHVLPQGMTSGAIVRPNPFNPQATVTFVTTTS
ncbi:MAG: PKD domain-containing protein, partial [Candidatus Eiseniibacteriota bacterium]